MNFRFWSNFNKAKKSETTSVDKSRRDFLVVSATATSGLVVGVQGLREKSWAESAAASATGDNAFVDPTDWLQIDPNGVITLHVDKSEMGQGVTTGHAMMVAEALGVSPNDVRIQFAKPGFKYRNREILNLLVMITGGSTSTKTAWYSLFYATAIVRESLQASAMEMAQKKNPAAAKIEAKEFKLQGKQMVGNGVGIPLSDVLDIAAKKTRKFLSEERYKIHELRGMLGADFKPQPANYKVLGKAHRRVDLMEKLTGRAVFGIDVEEPQHPPLVAVIRHAERIGAEIQSFDDSQVDRSVAMIVRVSNGLAVIARDYWTARNEARKITITTSDVRKKSPQAKAPANTTEQQERYRRDVLNLSLKGKAFLNRVRRVGELPFRDEAPRISLEAVYELPYLPHSTLEPMNCTVHISGGRCKVWVPTQAPAAAQLIAMEQTGFAKENVEIHTTLLGGGFGRRINQDFVFDGVDAALAYSKDPRFGDRAIKVIWSREEDFQRDFFRPSATHYVRGGYSREKKALRWEHRIATQSILSFVGGEMVNSYTAYWPKNKKTRESNAGLFQEPFKALMGAVFATMFGDKDVMSGVVIDPGAIEGVADLLGKPTLAYRTSLQTGFRVEWLQQTEAVPIGFWRSVGHSHTAFAIESFIDEIALQENFDPLEFRAQHFVDGELGARLRQVMYRAAKASGVAPGLNEATGSGLQQTQWTSAAGASRGLAVHFSFSTYVAVVVEARVRNGVAIVEKVTVAVDCGFVLNPDIVRAQVEGSVIFGLSAALKQKITIREGVVQETQFTQCDPLRLHECPQIHVEILPSEHRPTGIGEPVVPPIAPALANALARAGVPREKLRRLPLKLVDLG